MAPGANGLFFAFTDGGGPNSTIQAADFPFHKLSDPDNNASAVISDADDINNGTISGAGRTAGQSGHGGALSFSGTGDMVTVAEAASLDLTFGLTLEAWVNPSVLNGWQAVILKERVGGLAYSLYAHDGAPGDPSGTEFPAGYMNIYGVDQPIRGVTALPLNTWTHLAVTYDGSTMSIYVNGTLAASQAMSSSILTSGSPLRIGGNTVWGEFFTGLIDDVRVYNRALAQSEIQSDMAAAVQ